MKAIATDGTPKSIQAASVDELVAAFEREYERLFGAETGYAIEQWYPVIYLYRREAMDGGGVGKWRGGTGLESAITPYRAKTMSVVTNTGGQGVSSNGGTGLCGGLPAPPSRYMVRKGTDLLDGFAARRLPGSIKDLEAETTQRLAGKSNAVALAEGDVLELRVAGAGGYGDPLDRDPGCVARDVRFGYVSAAAARDHYGVALADSGEVDADETERLRGEIRSPRAGWRAYEGEDGRGPAVEATGEEPRPLHEYMEARDDDGARVLACSRCGEVLGGYADNYKRGLLLSEEPLAILPTGPDPSLFVDAAMVLRRFCCPGCQVLMRTEVVRADEPMIDDMRLGDV